MRAQKMRGKRQARAAIALPTRALLLVLGSFGVWRGLSARTGAIDAARTRLENLLGQVGARSGATLELADTLLSGAASAADAAALARLAAALAAALARSPSIAAIAVLNADGRTLACLRAGMNDHVGKPFDVNELMAIIGRHVARPTAAAAPLEATHAGGGAPATSGDFDLNGAVARFCGNLPIYRGALRGFAADCSEILRRMPELFDNNDGGATLHRMLHTLHGTAATVGANALADQAGQAEAMLREGAPPAVLAAHLHQLVPLLLRHVDSAVALAETLESAPGAERSGAAPARTPLQALANLALLLDASDMEAPQAFALLQGWLEASQPALCADLAEAIDLFDFALARRLCLQLQAAVAEASPI